MCDNIWDQNLNCLLLRGIRQCVIDQIEYDNGNDRKVCRFLCLLNFFAQSFTFKLTVTLSRNAKDVDFAYSITTRVPECLGSSLRCHRLEQVYSLGPLQLNKEVVLRTSSTLRNNRTLFTDDNGYQMIKRPYRKFINNTLARVRT